MPENFRHNLLLDIIKNKVRYGPRIANIYINSQCNLHCEYCWFHSSLNKKGIKDNCIPVISIKKNIDELKRMGVTYIVLSSHGEPWLHPNIAEIINHIKDNQIYLRVTTNLTFGEEKIRLAFAKADFLAITFSAPNKNLYKIIHSPANNKFYQNALSNIKLYSKLANKTGRPFLEIRYIITKNNYAFIEEMLKLADSFNIPQIRFRILDTTKYTKKLSLSPQEILILINNIKKLILNPYKVKTNLTDLFNSLNEKGEIDFTLNRCFVGWLRISLELNGDIGFCCQNDKLIIGNWKHKSIKEAWLGNQAKQLRFELKNKFDINKPFWNNCVFCFMEKENKELDSLLNNFGR